MLNRLLAADCDLELSGGLTRTEEQGILGELEGEFSRGRARGRGVHPGTSGTNGDRGLQTERLRQSRRTGTHRWQTQMGMEGQRHCA